jgi:uncharacterized protein with HEPN domain
VIIIFSAKFSLRQKIIAFTKPFADADSWNMDAKSFDAVLMNFVIIGECVIRLSDESKEAHSHIPWSKIKRFRNLVAHDYFGIDAEEVWQIAQANIPQLRADILQILALQ